MSERAIVCLFLILGTVAPVVAIVLILLEPWGKALVQRLGIRLLWPKHHPIHQYSGAEIADVMQRYHDGTEQLLEELRQARAREAREAWAAYTNAPDYATARRTLTMIIEKGY